MSVKIVKNDFAESGARLGLKNVNMETAIAIAAQATDFAPVKYGQLKNTIMAKNASLESGFNEGGDTPAPESHKLSVTPKDADAYAGTNSDHWYPEFGTRFQVAQPFMRPAKEIIVDGGKVKDIGLKYGKEAMKEEFSKRTVKRESRG